MIKTHDPPIFHLLFLSQILFYVFWTPSCVGSLIIEVYFYNFLIIPYIYCIIDNFRTHLIAEWPLTISIFFSNIKYQVFLEREISILPFSFNNGQHQRNISKIDLLMIDELHQRINL